MKFNEITENASAGSTGAGNVATVASPMSTQTRNSSIYGGKKAGNLLTGKRSKGKYANSVEARRQTKVNESMQDMSYTLYVDGQPKRESADRNTIVGYIKHLKSKGIKGPFEIRQQDRNHTSTIGEALEEVSEQEVLVVKGSNKRDRKSGFVPHGESRVDHEVQMAKADLFATAKNAQEIMMLLKDRTEEDGIKGWMQSYITLANDYLNSVAESLQYEMQMHEDQVAAYGNGADDRINTRNKLDKEPYGGPSSSSPGGALQSTVGGA